MSISQTPTRSLAADARGADALRAGASRDPKGAIREAAKQFEALFMQELMKSMRQATMSSGLLDNAGTKMGTDMLDTQFANKMTGMPGGLSDVIAQQLERQMGGGRTPAIDGSALDGLHMPPARFQRMPAATTSEAGGAGKPVSERQLDFVRRHTEAARAAEAETGIPASFMVGQAAHESGWGRREIRNADGSTAHNVFGIKAGGSWRGPVAEVTTTEYIGGVARKVIAKFRAYASYEESFRDYAALMRNSPRYGQVVTQADTVQGFAQGLQKAGYATDPAYADKLTRVINTTMRLQRMVT